MKLKNKSKEIKKEKFSIEKKAIYSNKEMDLMYKIVRDYLYEHQGENAMVVSEETGVPREVVMTFVSQGKISVLEDSKHMLHECKICGGLIEKGDICSDCLRKKMADVLQPEVRSSSRRKFTGKALSKSGIKDTNYGNRIRKS